MRTVYAFGATSSPKLARRVSSALKSDPDRQTMGALKHLTQLPHAGIDDHVFGQCLLRHAHARCGSFRQATAAFQRLIKLQEDNAGSYAGASLRILDALIANREADGRKSAISEGKRLAK